MALYIEIRRQCQVSTCSWLLLHVVGLAARRVTLGVQKRSCVNKNLKRVRAEPLFIRVACLYKINVHNEFPVGFFRRKKDTQANVEWKINTYVLVFRTL